jgi:3-isopropylmalate/(R)-2-methylmalate dehydratase small subunit
VGRLILQPFTVLEGVAAPFDRPNVDTDQIMPARYMRRPRNEGFQNFLFRDLRFDDAGHEIPEFVLNQAPYRHSRILVADRNFGGGSSREQAAWCLSDFGIRCVIAADFGDIFYLNSLKVGLLPVQLSNELCSSIRQQIKAQPGVTMRVDLPEQVVVAPDGRSHRFSIEPFYKHRLLEGLDDVGYTLKNEAAILQFEQSYREKFSWLFNRAP